MGPSRSSPFLRRGFEVSSSTDVSAVVGASTTDAVDANKGSFPAASKSGFNTLSPNIPQWAMANVSAGSRSRSEGRLSPSKERVAAGRASRLEPLVTVDELAAILNVSARTIRRLIASGEIPAVWIGRSVRLRLRDIRRIIAEGGICND